MKVHTTDDVEEYAAAAIPFLETEPCTRNVLRWVIEVVRAGHASTEPASFWWVEGVAGVTGAAHLTPPYPLLVSSLPDGAVAPLVSAVRERADAVGTNVHRLNGPRDAAFAVAAAWTAATGDAHHLIRTLLLHELETYADVPPPGGGRRAAGNRDVDLVTRWIAAFAEEVEMDLAASQDHRRAAAQMLERDEAELWEVNGVPVSLAGHRAPAAGVVRIGPVYTPPEQRNHGYARRLVAEVTAAEMARPDVRRCMLFTDTANPVSNSIYRQIGYVPRGEHVEIALGG